MLLLVHFILNNPVYRHQKMKLLIWFCFFQCIVYYKADKVCVTTNNATSCLCGLSYCTYGTRFCTSVCASNKCIPSPHGKCFQKLFRNIIKLMSYFHVSGECDSYSSACCVERSTKNPCNENLNSVICIDNSTATTTTTKPTTQITG